MNASKRGRQDFNFGGSEVEVSRRSDKIPRTRDRFGIRLAIFQGPYQKTIMLNYSVNLSTEGVFLETGNLLPVDALLTVKFKFPGSDAVISCLARVAWINEPGTPKKPALPPGMGLSFLDLTLNDLHALRNHLSKSDLIPTW